MCVQVHRKKKVSLLIHNVLFKNNRFSMLCTKNVDIT